VKPKHPEQPYFSSFEQFVAHIKGKEWSDTKEIFHHEYEATSYVGNLPTKKRLSDPNLDYEHCLGMFLLYVLSGVLPATVCANKNKRVCKMLEAIRADVESRGPWPPKDSP
jgi:hypothetical protein